MSEVERRRGYHYNRVLIETERILDPEFSDAVVFLSGAQVEMLRNVTQYLNRLETYVTEYQPGYYLEPTTADFDDILEIVADLEETLMGNPNTIFGYSDQISMNGPTPQVGAGTYTWDTGTIDEGKVWLLQSVSYQMPYHTRGSLVIMIQAEGGNHLLIQDDNPARLLHKWDGCITMKEGDELKFVHASLSGGEVVWASFIANEMDVPA